MHIGGVFRVIQHAHPLTDKQTQLSGHVLEVIDAHAVGFGDRAPAVIAGGFEQQQVEDARIGQGAQRGRPGGDALLWGPAFQSAMGTVVVARDPTVAKILQRGGGQTRQFDGPILDEQAVRELLAGAEGFAVGDVVADVARQQLQ